MTRGHFESTLQELITTTIPEIFTILTINKVSNAEELVIQELERWLVASLPKGKQSNAEKKGKKAEKESEEIQDSIKALNKVSAFGIMSRKYILL